MNSDFGYPMIVGVASVFLLRWLGVNVMVHRKKAEIKYPIMYATSEQAEKDPAKHLFNCSQRAHQNTLENIFEFYVLLAIGSLTLPRASSGFGALWIIGRIFYCRGYMTGNPAKRQNGTIQYVGVFGLLGTSIYTIYTILKA